MAKIPGGPITTWLRLPVAPRTGRAGSPPPPRWAGGGGALPGGQPQGRLVVGLVGHAGQDRLHVLAGERVDRQAGGVVVLPGQGEAFPLVVGVRAAGHGGPPSGGASRRPA